MSQRAGHESVSFLTAVLYPDHWPAFQRRTVLQGDGCILFSEIPLHWSQVPSCTAHVTGGLSERAQARKSGSVLVVNNTDATSLGEGHASQECIWKARYCVCVKYIEMVILCHIRVKWLQWFGKVALTVPCLIIHKSPVLCKVDFIGVLQEKYIPVSELPRNRKNPSLTEFAGSSFQKVRSKTLSWWHYLPPQWRWW